MSSTLSSPTFTRPADTSRTASPSYFLTKTFSHTQISGGTPLSPSTRSPGDVLTPKSGLPRGSGRRDDEVMGTAADDASGFFAAAAASQQRPVFNLTPFGSAPTFGTSMPPTPGPSSSPRWPGTPISEGRRGSGNSFGSGFGGPLSASNAPSMPSAKMPTRRVSATRLHASSSRFSPISASELVKIVQEETTLVLDLRPHAAYAGPTGHLVNSLNICVPTTLLRRAAYSLSRIAETMTRPERLRLLDSIKTCHHIVALDQDSSTLHTDGTLHALLTKFDREGFKGELHWVKGGYASVKQAASANEVETPVVVFEGSGSASSSSLNLGNSGFNSSTSSLSSQASSSSLSSLRQGSESPILRVRDLPVAAFQAGSTKQYERDQAQLASGQETLSPKGRPGATAHTRTAANPFFDNIRQNQESLNLTRSMKDLADFDVPAVFERSREARSRLPSFLQSLVDLPAKERAERLAREFFEIEEREQHRLQDLMSWHASRDQAAGAEDDFNPLSISAGVEKGHLNRYRNIFPYEHARARLAHFSGTESDYINASHIRLRGSTHSYIATQGPMASSYADFWQLVYQEQSPVILMLTNLKEAGREKCGAYFRPGKYGKITVERVEACEAATEDDDLAARRGSGTVSAGGFFGPQSPGALSGVLRRTLRIVHDDHPLRPHTVRHIHFASWPDFDVPPDPHQLLSLVQDVNDAKQGSAAPVIAHCSAGVGRTGSFIAVDVVLDSLTNPPSTSPTMAVDEAQASERLPSSMRATPPLATDKPMQAVVDEMREQRMSMVANAAQYRFCHTAILEALASSSH